jgi:hypothetical protein
VRPTNSFSKKLEDIPALVGVRSAVAVSGKSRVHTTIAAAAKNLCTMADLIKSGAEL